MISIGQNKSEDWEICLYPRDQIWQSFCRLWTGSLRGRNGRAKLVRDFSFQTTFVRLFPPACLFLSFTYNPIRGACSQAKISMLAEIVYTNWKDAYATFTMLWYRGNSRVKVLPLQILCCVGFLCLCVVSHCLEDCFLERHKMKLNSRISCRFSRLGQQPFGPFIR